MFDNFEIHRITANGCDIACVAAGEGEPVLMLHGFPQSMAIWAQAAPALVSRGYRIICTDLRGYGASQKPPATKDLSNYSFRTMALDQYEVMRQLGHQRFHVVGHDRGARTAYRLALDHPDAVASVTLMDIVPTDVLLTDLRKEVAQSYWHWFFLAQPAPFPERVIAGDPDFFFENCLFGWGAAGVEDFDAQQLAAYRASWRDEATIAGYCNDYRAALAVDVVNDLADRERRIAAPTLVLYGGSGSMARLYDIPTLWAQRCEGVASLAMPGGHFFPDSAPGKVVEAVDAFLAGHPLQPLL
ncbi:TPA: alpha/beta hydrolase [Pseudomonas aeruginosa]|nr:alpha/beta hydrolase [Pseudomonas aeruginosa]